MNKVTITVSGSVGSGKSALCGEIEILCKALGLQVEWIGGRDEKNLTGADWIHEIEMYKPSVKIVEQIERTATAATDNVGGRDAELSLQAKYEDACIQSNKNAQDAERYRWMRDFNVRCKDGVQIKPPCEHVFASIYSHEIGAIPTTRLVTGEDLDRAIDAALSQKAGEKE